MDPDKNFVVCTDACNEGLGGVITKEGHIIAYESRKLKTHENNYATYDLELAAIIHALKMWRHHLIGKIFLLTLQQKLDLASNLASDFSVIFSQLR